MTVTHAGPGDQCGHRDHGWRCNRPTAHRGEHMAVIGGKPIATWSERSERARRGAAR